MRGTRTPARGAGQRAVSTLFLVAFGLAMSVRAQLAEDVPAAAQPSTRANAPLNLTGNWVAVISEDWRWRMITPARGDFPSIPLNFEGQQVAEAWDPARDEATGEQCRAYGAPGLMRGPTRLRIAWRDDVTLQLDSDYGMQTRLFHFDGAERAEGSGTWQGVSTARWIMAGGGRGVSETPHGSMKSVTSGLRPGYLRKNGVPYSAGTVFTEYWDVHREENGDQYLVVTNSVEDPVYLQQPWLTAIHFKREANDGKWDPTPCDPTF